MEAKNELVARKAGVEELPVHGQLATLFGEGTEQSTAVDYVTPNTVVSADTDDAHLASQYPLDGAFELDLRSADRPRLTACVIEFNVAGWNAEPLERFDHG